MSDLGWAPGQPETIRDALLRRVIGLPPDLLDEVLPAIQRAVIAGADFEALCRTMEHWFKTPVMALQAEAALRAFAAGVPAPPDPPPEADRG